MKIGPVCFDAAGAAAVIRATREAQRRPKAVVRRPQPPQLLPLAKVVLVSKAIQPGSGATPGTGTATLCAFDGTQFNDLGIPVDVYNLTEATLKVGAYVQVLTIDGHYFYDVTACSNGS